ncbi:MAG: thrombospondin type 3 repeat-containing protein [Acidobacteriota bacterium]
MRLSTLALLPLVLLGCRRVPESVLLTIEGEASPAAFLRLSVYDQGGATVRDRPLGAPGASLTLPATVVLYPPDGSTPLRIDVKAILGGAIQSEGAVSATPLPGEQVSARIVLRAGALPDLDGDGVPDAIDNCRAIQNPDQRPGGCPGDAGVDRRDAPADASPDHPRDLAGDRPSDQRGLDHRVDAREDHRPADLKKPDLKKPDLRPTDLRPPDKTPLAPDLAVYKPVTASALSTAFAAATVPCINAQGVNTGSTTAIVDTPAVSFVVPVLGSAPATTVSWLGGKPSLLVIWDPNACDPVELPPNGPDWVSAGILIRGASLDALGRLQLAPGTKVTDLDLVDATVSGVISEEFFLPDDSTLSTFPQLVQPVLAAKQIILTLAAP